MSDARADNVSPAPATTISPPITKNDYALELFQGPVLAPSRVTGLAGAYTAYAEGVEGVATNAAAPAVREPYSLKWFDFGYDLSASLPGGYAGTDFDNRGAQANPTLVERTNHFLFVSAGLRAQAGAFGAALTGELLRYDVIEPKANTPGLALAAGRYHAVAAYALWDGQLVVGGGARVVTLSLSESHGDFKNAITDKPLITMTGAAPEVGVVIKPTDKPYRIGATARMPVTGAPFLSGSPQGSTFDGARRAGDYILPESIVLPWEIEAGFALQLGPRPLNPKWINPHVEDEEVHARIQSLRRQRAAAIDAATSHEERRRLQQADRDERVWEDNELKEEDDQLFKIRKARYANWPRERLLIVGSLLMTGASSDAVALEGFLDQKRELVGRSITLTPRAGIEAEPIENRAHVRLGGYVEPTRFSDGSPRQHFTFGGDVKLFTWDPIGLTPDPFQLSLIVDVAPRYSNYGIGLGVWH